MREIIYSLFKSGFVQFDGFFNYLKGSCLVAELLNTYGFIFKRFIFFKEVA